MPLVARAGFSTLDKAIDYVSGSDKEIEQGSAENDPNVQVAAGDVLCARDLGIFAGEEMILTVIATTHLVIQLKKLYPLLSNNAL